MLMGEAIRQVSIKIKRRGNSMSVRAVQSVANRSGDEPPLGFSQGTAAFRQMNRK